MLSGDNDVDVPKTKRRFCMLLIFCLCTIINAIGWICFAAIASVLTDVKNCIITFSDFGNKLIYCQLYVDELHDYVCSYEFSICRRTRHLGIEGWSSYWNGADYDWLLA